MQAAVLRSTLISTVYNLHTDAKLMGATCT